MKDFLDNIARLSFENLTTEVLRIILDSLGFEIYQKAFYNYIFENSDNKSTKEYFFEIISQKRFGSDQPDILITSKEKVFIIENKFFAKFSGDNQISRYKKLLVKDYSDIADKTIFLLTLEKQKKYYKDLLSKELGENFEENKDVRIKFIFWDEIIELFKSNNFLIEALEGYLKKYYLTEVKFSKEEYVMLNSKNIPETLYKIFNTVDHIRAEIENHGFETISYRSSQDYHGFYLIKGGLKSWFGSAIDWWKGLNENPTPFFLQVRDDWNTSVNFDNSLKDILNQLNFIYREDAKWIKPYSPSLIENDLTKLVENISDDISIILKNITIKET